MSKKITQQVWELAQPVVEGFGLKLWDVEYVREGGEWFLRLYIDKAGGVNINDCEAISKDVDPILDREDPIEGSYRFEVCSAGLERQLKRPSDFEAFLGADILVKLYRPVDGVREFPCVLRGYDNGDLTVEYAGKTLTFPKAQIALVRLRAEF
jgi:ribosome maturation factor RimP